MQIRDERPQHNTVTLSKFAQHVGRSVDVFIKVRSWPKACAGTHLFLSQQKRQLDTTEYLVPQWQIGGGGVQPHEIVIVGAVQVSSGSWMPILQLTRYIF